MNQSSAQPLFDAVARRAGVVLSLPGPQRLIHLKSYFLAAHDAGVWVKTVGDEHVLQQLIANGQPIGVSFRGGDTRHVFASPLLRHEPDHELEPGASANALLLAFPTEIKAVQRRSSYRVRVSPDSELSARCWRMSRRARLQDRPTNAQQLTMQVCDISLGGIGVLFFGADNQDPKVTCEDRLRVELAYGDAQLLIEGRMRKPDATKPGSIRTGIRFVFLQEGIRDRKALSQLTRIVSQLQREEARHRRIRKKTEQADRAA